MATIKRVWIECDGCHEPMDDGSIGHATTVREARVDAKQYYGAVRRKIDGRMRDLCENCADRDVEELDLWDE